MRSIGYIIVILLLAQCNTDTNVNVPRAYPLTNVNNLPEVSRQLMNGYYHVIAGSDQFGTDIVLKWNPDQPGMASLFAANNYCVLRGGYSGDIIQFRGYWRTPTSDARGLVDLTIAATDGASDLVQSKSPGQIILKGKYGLNDGLPSRNFVITFEKNLPNLDFFVIGHRGGGRTSDRLPYSENTKELIRYASNLGCNGVEIDVRLTRDLTPVLYHDNDINIRLTTKGPINGDIADYTYNEILAYVRLIRGEKIPKLEDVLEFIIDSTSLKFVYLDMKDQSVNALVDAVIACQKKALVDLRQSQQINHRDPLMIVMCIPNNAIYQKVVDYRKTYPTDTLLTLCELDLPNALAIESSVWSRPWTLGITNFELKQFKNSHANRKTLFWTVDQPQWIRNLIDTHSNLDGLVTNYPSNVFFQYYMYHK